MTDAITRGPLSPWTPRGTALVRYEDGEIRASVHPDPSDPTRWSWYAVARGAGHRWGDDIDDAVTAQREADGALRSMGWPRLTNAAVYKWTAMQCTILGLAAHPTPEKIARCASRGEEPGIGVRGPGKSMAAYKLHQAGLGELVSCPGDSRFYINDAGRAALRDAVVHAEAEASRHLGNYNAAKEEGDLKKADKLYAHAQKWLDAANHLRNQGSS